MVPPTNNRIVLLTGDGKGKTTSALGMVLRAVGHDLPVALIQFLKADATVGELKALSRLPHVEIRQCGRGFVPPPGSPRFAVHQAAAEEGLLQARTCLQSPDLGLVVLDEICGAIACGLLTTAAVLETLRQARPGLIVVLTGRQAAPELVALADTVSQIENVKHGMDAGWPPQAGVEC